MLYTIKANQLRVAFVEENDGEGAVVNDLYQGDAAFFPQGLIHYQQNLDCEQATFLAALNSEDPGVVTITTRFFDLPSEAIQVSYTKLLHMVQRSNTGQPYFCFDLFLIDIFHFLGHPIGDGTPSALWTS